jgi:hypothetical protein
MNAYDQPAGADSNSVRARSVPGCPWRVHTVGTPCPADTHAAGSRVGIVSSSVLIGSRDDATVSGRPHPARRQPQVDVSQSAKSGDDID